MVLIAPVVLLGQEEKIPEKVLCSPVLLLMENGRQGTGVFMCDTNYLFFLTARHNLLAQKMGEANHKLDTAFELISSKGCFTFYSNNITADTPLVLNIDLKRAFVSKYIQYDKKNDVAIILLGAMKNVHDSVYTIDYFKHVQEPKAGWIPSTSVKWARMYNEINIGGEIYLLGYPSSIGLQAIPQFDYTRPLLRKGIIAGKYEKNKTILIDCPSYWGNSGGPVYELVKTNLFTTEIKLIGIVSEYIPYYDIWENKRTGFNNVQAMNSGYSVITPIDDVLDLISRFHK
ncbi:MAG: trypsin-like peptidase domain-containing protein [Bacteroidia bacterium]